MAQDDDEGHEWAPRPANLQMSEMTPVGLGLLARKRAQAQISLGLGARPVAGDHVTEVTAVTAVTPLNDHAVKTGSRQAGKGLQGLKDEREIGVDLAGSGLRAMGHQPGSGKHSMNGVVVDAELPGNGASAPLLDMVIAQDLGLQLRRYGHRYPQDGDVRMAWRRRRGSRRTNREQRRLHQ
ncbi:hypothetical protein J1C56_28405 [Aminobacter anthyllidis]|uniref:Uncharacterized protein n=1 Tax=Aminobacter anthyllidis TaxID=1035067 RepID=A0A9X1AH24_9HYPH|nr:hypothetical protein [Aminobacter anthyllidis]MBT1159491.1 hypothetical protein [Aminobacter anthyllidis]